MVQRNEVVAVELDEFDGFVGPVGHVLRRRLLVGVADDDVVGRLRVGDGLR